MASAGKQDQDAAHEDVIFRSSPDPKAEAELSTRILMALDSISEYDIENGGSVVYDYIDLDALDELFTPTDETGRNGKVTFCIDQYEITATADGAVTISRRS